ncbi:MAG: deaminase [Bacteroidetes bacterium]|nr:deaminase [Bacteroidota bacterium]
MKKNVLIYSVLLFAILSCAEKPSQRTIIQTENAPAAIGPYSQAILVGNTLYAAGQIGLVPETGELAGEDLESQTRQTLHNLQAVLDEAGFTMNDVVSVDVYLRNLDDYSSFNEIYTEYFSESKPARGVVEVSRIPRDAKVEIKLVAVK